MTAEALLLSSLVLALFWLRPWVGLSPLYIALGVFQYMQVLLALSLYIEIVPGVLISPGSAVLFTGSLFAVLLVYIREDAQEARKLIYGLLAANLVLSLFSVIVGLHFGRPAARNLLGLPEQIFFQNPRILVAGTLTLFADALLIILLYETVSRFLRQSLFLRISTTMSLVLVFDSIVFTTLSFLGQDAYFSILVSGIIGKLVAGIFYSSMLAIYLNQFDASDADRMSFVRDIGDLFGILTYRQKYEILRTKLTRDALTGVFNRGFFDDLLPTELALGSRLKRPVTLLMADVDHFKKINDNYGHLAGDQVLKLVAETMASSLRSTDVLCRYGGEEFAAVLLDCDCPTGAELAERLRHEVRERLSNEGPLRSVEKVTLTIGAACYPTDGETPEELIKVADSRLYAGKKAGRDRVVSSS